LLSLYRIEERRQRVKARFFYPRTLPTDYPGGIDRMGAELLVSAFKKEDDFMKHREESPQCNNRLPY